MQKNATALTFFFFPGSSFIHSLRNKYKTEVLVIPDRGEREADDVNRTEGKCLGNQNTRLPFRPLNSFPKIFEVVKSIFCIISQTH